MWSLKVATYNIFLPVPEGIRFTGQKQRVELLPQEIFNQLSDVDVICVQELIPPQY